ncbi:MAG: Nif3-like dinuclear metal center hexameric protein, partial [Mucinivorans sp.]
MIIQEIIHIIENFAPLALQEKWDNSGLQIGDTQSEVTGVVMALDVTDRVVDSAIANHSNLIITHHPMFFEGVKNILPTTSVGKIIYRAIQNNITIYSSHTPTDSTHGGINDFLAHLLGLVEIEPLEKSPFDPTCGMGRVGNLPVSMSTEAFNKLLYYKLALTTLPNNAHKKNDTVRRVALCGGSGASLITTAIEAGADTFVCGDLKYHDFQRTDNTLALYDVGHYGSEICFVDIIQKVLEKEILEISKKVCTFALRSVKDNF